MNKAFGPSLRVSPGLCALGLALRLLGRLRASTPASVPGVSAPASVPSLRVYPGLCALGLALRLLGRIRACPPPASVPWGWRPGLWAVSARAPRPLCLGFGASAPGPSMRLFPRPLRLGLALRPLGRLCACTPASVPWGWRSGLWAFSSLGCSVGCSLGFFPRVFPRVFPRALGVRLCPTCLRDYRL